MLFTFDSKKPSKHETSMLNPKRSISSTKNDLNSSLKVLDDEGFVRMKSSHRSKNGCLTCKTRKKKCDEARPKCSDCVRLNKQCVYVDHDNMTSDEIKAIRELVEEKESKTKLRKRKKADKLGGKESKKPHLVATPDSPDISTLLGQELSHSLSTQSLIPSESVAETQIVHKPNIESPSSDSENEGLEEMGGIHFLDKMVKYSPNFQESPLSPTDLFNYFKEMNLGLPNDTLKTSSSFSSLDLNSLMGIPSPSPRILPNVLSDLSDRGRFLFDYYVNVLCPKISIAPLHAKTQDNYYKQVFLPLAQNDIGVMHSILAWACFFLGGHDNTNEGTMYLNKALEHFHTKMGSDKATAINKLALLMITLGAELCRGDVTNWTQYMEWGSKVLRSYGGLANFKKSKEEVWLVSNFAYHDVLSSNKVDKGLYFSGDQYSEFFTHDFANGILHPLVGIAKDLFTIIGYISSLVFETNKKLQTLNTELNDKNVSGSPIYEIDNDGDEDSESILSKHAQVNEILLSVKGSALKLDEQIDQAKPNPDDLINLTEEEFEWQITLFETYKLSAKLYLRQAILKCNPSYLECQILNNDLIKCLDIILGSPVEASLVFPVFIAGIHCVTPLDRRLMRDRIEKFIQTYGPWSIVRAREVIEKSWERNPGGDKVVDWHAILKEMGWDLNFA